ncbi:hypothetical protein T07_14519 [Trichinella nelsoni]|uniref:Uncharacterized protein n=1 Tax=Trichinella nelsoni TaxID=6336 RepID=A0A0V0RHQ5_9BILA|nr:hypothetical protein T07_14519 [Trichinella nelsoni]
MRAFDSLKVALEHYLKRNSDHCAKLINLEVIWKPTKAETLLSTSEEHRFGSEVLAPDDSGSEYLNGGSSKFSGTHLIENCTTVETRNRLNYQLESQVLFQYIHINRPRLIWQKNSTPEGRRDNRRRNSAGITHF